MPPSGPRSRNAPRGAPDTSTRNEVFENIFGRPAGGHHLGSAPGAALVPGGGGSGGAGAGGASVPPTHAHAHPPYPPRAALTLNPAQPSFPPAQPSFPPAQPSFPPQFPPHHAPSHHGQSHAPGHAHAPHATHATPRAPPAQYGTQPAFPPTNDYQRAGYDAVGGLGAYARTPTQASVSTYAAQSVPDLGERRASLAPSTYSNSSGSIYSPNPTVSPPAPASSGRLPAAAAAFPSHSAHNGYARPAAGVDRLPLPPAKHDAYSGTIPSPASSVFPMRAGAPTTQAAPAAGPSRSRSSFGSSTSPPPPLPPHSQAHARSPPERPTLGLDRAMSPPPDYLRAMTSMSLDRPGAGLGKGGMLDDVPIVVGTGDLTLDGPWAASDVTRRTPSEPPVRRAPDTRQPSLSRISTRSTHTRMPSDSSVHSTYTLSGTGRIGPLSSIDQSPGGPDSPGASPSTPTGSDIGGFVAHAFRRLSGRKSMDSTQSLPLPASESPLPPGAAPPSAFDGRATSFSGGSVNRKDVVNAMRSGSVSRRSGGPVGAPSAKPLLARNASLARQAVLRAMPHIYPALLSQVADGFRQLIALADLDKDGISYKDAFDGRTAVSIIADIIKTQDRNLALLLGRALDAQKFFHDVTYAHRLRDTPNEIYQFKERLVAPLFTDHSVTDSPSSEHISLSRPPSSGGPGSSALAMTRTPHRTNTSDSGSFLMSDSQTSFFPSPVTSTTTLTNGKTGSGPGSASMALVASEATAAVDDDLPVGVFTLLTECYSPTCTKEQLCYSINCPRRLEQMQKLNMNPQRVLKRQESIHDVKPTGTPWVLSVPKEVVDSVDDKEKMRQEAINEVIYTERDFVRDLEYLRDSWVKPLRTQEVIAAGRRDDFVRQVFWNVHDVLAVNVVLADRLTKRQKQQPVVQAIGDLFLERVPHFEPFVAYGGHQLFGKYEFEKEKGANAVFQKFVDDTERKPESRKLELNGYLTKPTTRLGRYPLLLEAVLKHTPDGHPDKRDLPEVIKQVKSFLAKVNEESGKAENIFELAQLEQQLVFRPTETIDLRLRDKNRKLIHKGPVKRRGGNQGENADLLAFLFDHALLLVKPKWVNKVEQYKVYRRPIPLELLVLIAPEDSYNSAKLSATRNKLIARPTGGKGSVSGATAHVPPKPEGKHGFSLTVVHLGKKGYSLQLWVDSYVGRKKWLEEIDKQQQLIRDRSTIFSTETITDGYFRDNRKITCVSPYDNGNRMIYGTEEGVYFSNRRDARLREPAKVINLVDVTQVDVIELYQLLIVLHERTVTTFPLDCLDPNDPNAALKRGKRISSHTNFFKTGNCLNRILIAVVKSSTLSSTIKVLEPLDMNARGKKPQSGFMKKLNGGQDTLKVYKEFYIPFESFSVHFLKTKICIGGLRGFEIVDLDTLDMQSLLDPNDPKLNFVARRGDHLRPMAIYRVDLDFLLCYDEFAFYVDKNGWRAKSRAQWAIIWEGTPTAFAMHYPYILAFEPTFIEVRHVETGHLVQIIPGNNISCLFTDVPLMSAQPAAAPPARQLMYHPNNSAPVFRPPPHGHASGPAYPGGAGAGAGFPEYPHGQGSYRPPMGYGPPPGTGGGMAPPPQPPAPPGQAQPRNEIIFTSDDGHVQFLVLPPAPARGAPIAARRPSEQQRLDVRVPR
ncbi:RHO1 GDP-GTP exchange protein 2 [Cryptotrichosporon argae]